MFSNYCRSWKQSLWQIMLTNSLQLPPFSLSFILLPLFVVGSFSTSYEMEADGHWPAIFIRSNFCFKYSIWSSQTQNIFNILSICYKDHEKCNRQFWVRILKISTTFLIYNLPLFFITTQKELKHKLVALQLPSLPAASPLSIF